jgi:hypothetical protein
MKTTKDELKIMVAALPVVEAVPESQVCDTLWNGLQRCQSVGEVSLAMALHLAECPACQQRRKEAA